MADLAAFLDSDRFTVATFADARAAFESWAAIGPGELPEDSIDAMQVRLMRWQRDRFGDQAPERMALGVIEEHAESLLAFESRIFTEARDALGDAMVYAGQLAMGYRLALGPILQLATIIEPTPIIALASYGVLAQVTLKGTQKVRGLDDTKKFHTRLVGALATVFYSIAASFDETIRYGDIYLEVGEQVLQRAAGHDAIPKLTVH